MQCLHISLYEFSISPEQIQILLSVTFWNLKKNIFSLCLVESVGMESMDVEDQLYLVINISCIL
jgi:hypothetical protein